MATPERAGPESEDRRFLRRELGEDGVLRLTMDRPERRNALGRSAVSELRQAFAEAADDRAVRAIVLASTGSVFSSGHDLRELRRLTARAASAAETEAEEVRAEAHRLFAECSDLMVGIVRHPKAVIASVQGLATAAGCQLALSCDLVVAARSARFMTPGVDLGLFCSTPAVALGRALGRKPAMEMLLLAEPLGAERAWQMGMINRVVDDEELEQTVRQIAERVASRPARTIALGKAATYRQLEEPLEEAYRRASEAMALNLLDPEADAGIGAFFDKRAVDFREV